jgi:hypothetical protein
MTDSQINMKFKTQNFEKCTNSISDESDNFSTTCRATRETEQFSKQPIQNYNGNKYCNKKKKSVWAHLMMISGLSHGELLQTGTSQYGA